MKWTVLLLTLACLAGCLGAQPGATEQHQALTTTGYRSLAVHWGPSGVELVKQRRVAGALQRLKTPISGPWRVEVRSPDGSITFTAMLEAPNLVRGEFLDGQPPAIVLQPEATFLVNLPEPAQASTLQVWAQRWTLSEAAPGSEEWVKLGEVAIP